MAQDDLLIDEVNTGVRGDQARNFLKTYRWLLVLIVVGVIAFVAYMSFSTQQKQSAGKAQFDALSQSVANEGATENTPSEKEGELSALEAARHAAQSGDQDAALAHYQDIENNGDSSDTMKEFARLQAYGIEGGEPKDLANPGASFMIEAKLIEANALLGEGKQDEALVVLEALLANPEVQSERAFIESVVLALGGEIQDQNATPAPTASETEPSQEEDSN